MKLLRIAMVNQVKKNNSDDLFTRIDKTEKKLTSSVKLVSIIIIVVLFIILAGIGGLYAYTTMPVNINDTSSVSFVVNQGDSVYSVLNRLGKAGLIYSKRCKLFWW